LLLGVYSILAIGFYVQKNTDIASIWLLVIPLFSFILLRPKEALLYSALALATMFLLFQLHPESASFMEKFRVIAFGFFLVGTLYILSKSRKSAWNETENHVNNLEHKVEEALSQRLEQEKLLIQSSKMATLGELLSSIAHQWKQPISSISAITMNLRLQEHKYEEPNEARLVLLDQLEGQTQFMSETMNDFRLFFKPDQQQAAFDITADTQKLINLFKRNFEAQGITVKLNKINSIQVFGYSNMLKQALLNVLINAKEAIEENKPTNKNIDIAFNKENIYGIVTIQDYAGGIPNNIINKIFEKHFTTKGENGSGIGLAMTKEIVEDFFHGKIAIENIDDGTKVSIYIPLYQEE